jgi:hypothetical protein
MRTLFHPFAADRKPSGARDKCHALRRRGNSPRTALRVLPKSRNDGANGGAKISKDLKA